MNVLDIILLILLIAASISGFSRGLFVELASIISIVLGIWAGISLSGYVQIWLSKWIHWSRDNVKLIAFILIFLAVVVIIHVVATVFEKTVRAVSLGVFSRLAGAVFGALKAAFVLSILILLIANIEYYTTTIIPDRIKRESKLYKPIERFALNVLPFLKSYQKLGTENKGNPIKV